jgi:hypothetical protein
LAGVSGVWRFLGAARRSGPVFQPIGEQMSGDFQRRPRLHRTYGTRRKRLLDEQAPAAPITATLRASEQGSSSSASHFIKVSNKLHSQSAI